MMLTLCTSSSNTITKSFCVSIIFINKVLFFNLSKYRNEISKYENMKINMKNLFSFIFGNLSLDIPVIKFILSACSLIER